MSPRPRGNFANVDQLIESTSLSDVLSHYGQPLPENPTGEHRMDCVFNTDCVDSTYGQLSVNQQAAARTIYCHACGTRGNLLSLIYGLETHRPPNGDRLRGEEFKLALRKLKEISGSADQSSPVQSPAPTIAATEPAPKPEKSEPIKNVPLATHENPAACKIADLYNDLVTDVASMTPHASSYFRERVWLTPELATKWNMGYLPKSGRSMMRGYVVYSHHNEAGEVLTYTGRDVQFDQKWQKWIQDGRPASKRPAKHKVVKGYAKGLELFGQQASRLEEPELRTSLDELGLIVVEGPNDVMRLDALGAAAVGLCSNKATEEQVSKIVRFANRVANGQVVLMPDNDAEGEAGFNQLALLLLEAGVSVRKAWSSTMHEGKYAGKEPEDLTTTEWQTVRASLAA